MNREELEQIAQRPSCCKPFGANVTLSVGERDELVAMARDGMRYRWLRDESQGVDLFGSNAPYVIEGETTEPLSYDALDEAVDAQMAKEEA